ncbi:hypothetical protein EDD21DRAFT_381839 [Dissophora ornata]|nr:hypothetical protein EDD21DRAFT_381839 [Dissophora ornata]
MESEAPSEIPSTQTAQVVVRELMDGQADGRSEARSKRADESNNRGQGMTTTRSSPYEGPRQGRGNEGNYLEKRNNEVEREDELGNPNDTAIPAVAIEYQPLHRGGAANRSGLAKSKNYSWVAPATGKNAILQRAVSAASSRFIRTYSSRPLSSSNLYQDPYHRPGAPMFPRTGVISFRKNPILPPKSVNRVSSRGQPNPSGNVITTIKPEHQQQQMRQLQIENDSAYNSQGRSDGDYRPMLRNYRQLVNSGYDIQGSGIRTSDTEVFTNPGPPPQPPQLAATPSTRLAQPSSRGYAYPIHIRPQTRVSGIQQTLGSGNNAQTLYGYM